MVEFSGDPTAFGGGGVAAALPTFAWTLQRKNLYSLCIDIRVGPSPICQPYMNGDKALLAKGMGSW